MKYEDQNYDDIFDFEPPRPKKKRKPKPKTQQYQPQQELPTVSNNIYITNTNTTRRSDDSVLDGCARVVIVLCMLVWSGVALAGAASVDGTAGLIGAFVMLGVGWIVVWFLYWLGYKLYWLTLAAGWVISMFFLLANLNL